MKKSIPIVFFLLILSAGLFSQSITGTVTYQQITKLDFETVFDEQGMKAIKKYFGGELPESKKIKKLNRSNL